MDGRIVIVIITIVVIFVLFIAFLLFKPAKGSPRTRGIKERAIGEKYYAGSWRKTFRLYTSSGAVIYEGAENRRVRINVAENGTFTVQDAGVSNLATVGWIGFDNPTGRGIDVTIYDSGQSPSMTSSFSYDSTLDYPFRVPWAEAPWTGVGDRLEFTISNPPSPASAFGVPYFVSSWDGEMKVTDGSGVVFYRGAENRRVLIHIAPDGSFNVRDIGVSGEARVGYLGFENASSFNVNVLARDNGVIVLDESSAGSTPTAPYRIPWSEHPWEPGANGLRFLYTVPVNLTFGQKYYAGSWNGLFRLYTSSGTVLYTGAENRRVTIRLLQDGRFTVQDAGVSSSPTVGWIGFENTFSFGVTVFIEDGGNVNEETRYDSTLNHPYRVPWAERPWMQSGNRLVFWYSRSVEPIPGTRTRGFTIATEGANTRVSSVLGYDEPGYIAYGRGALDIVIDIHGYITIGNSNPTNSSTLRGIVNRWNIPYKIIVDGRAYTNTFPNGASASMITLYTFPPLPTPGVVYYNGLAGIGDTPINKLMWINTHNAHTYFTGASLGSGKFSETSDCFGGYLSGDAENVANQTLPLRVQFELGVRHFKFPLLKCDGVVTASHSSCLADGQTRSFASILRDLDSWSRVENTFIRVDVDYRDPLGIGVIAERPTDAEIYTSLIESGIPLSSILARNPGGYWSEAAMSSANPTLPSIHQDWPTLRTLAAAGKRFVFFSPSNPDSTNETERYFAPDSIYGFQTQYQFSSPEAMLNEDMSIYRVDGDNPIYWADRGAWNNARNSWVVISQALTPPGWLAGCVGAARLLNSYSSLKSRYDRFAREAKRPCGGFGLDFFEVPLNEAMYFAVQTMGASYP